MDKDDDPFGGSRQRGLRPSDNRLGRLSISIEQQAPADGFDNAADEDIGRTVPAHKLHAASVWATHTQKHDLSERRNKQAEKSQDNRREDEVGVWRLMTTRIDVGGGDGPDDEQRKPVKHAEETGRTQRRRSVKGADHTEMKADVNGDGSDDDEEGAKAEVHGAKPQMVGAGRGAMLNLQQ